MCHRSSQISLSISQTLIRSLAGHFKPSVVYRLLLINLDALKVNFMKKFLPNYLLLTIDPITKLQRIKKKHWVPISQLKKALPDTRRRPPKSNWLGEVANLALRSTGSFQDVQSECFFPFLFPSLTIIFLILIPCEVFMILLSIFALPWPENNKVIVYMSQATALGQYSKLNQRWICYDVGHTNWIIRAPDSQCLGSLK